MFEPRPPCRRTTVHPHGRGDNAACEGFAAAPGGSPPRAWGQYEFAVELQPAPRFTPTGVGTITSSNTTAVAATVHPHGRGDNPPPSSEPSRQCGSPPRAWGQSSRRPRLRDARRFTPTGVGTMLTRPGGSVGWTVHPHGRGDNDVFSADNALCSGSPPRAWGQFGCGWNEHCACRFTPTGVGTMTPSPTPTLTPPVHPHGRGDNHGTA